MRAEDTSQALRLEEVRATASHFTSEFDEFQAVRFTKSKLQWIRDVSFDAYLSEGKSHRLLRLRIWYEGKGWLFIRSVIFLVGDQRFEVKDDWDTDTRDGGVSEKLDRACTKDDLAMLRAIRDAYLQEASVKVRLNGDRDVRDFTLARHHVLNLAAAVELLDEPTLSEKKIELPVRPRRAKGGPGPRLDLERDEAPSAEESANAAPPAPVVREGIPKQVSSGVRTWTHQDGRKIEAFIVSATDADVVFRRLEDLREFTFPIARLSQPDVEYVKAWREYQAWLKKP